MVHFFIKNRYYFLFQALSLVVFIAFNKFSEAGINDGDSISHYYISRYSWHYPYLFLDNWGKPFFILLSSPFAQLGYGGVQFFNITCAVISSWFCYRTAEKLDINWAYAAPVFLLFTPVYLSAVPSGLTEILFGLVFIVSIYLMVDNKYIGCAFIISFLPFCRTEGILIIPVFGLMMLIGKKFTAIPFLLSGFLIYSGIGYFYYKDFLWILHTNPYQTINVYGHGTLDFFFKSRSAIFSDLLGTVFAIGAVFLGFRLAEAIRNKNIPINLIIECLVIWGSFMVYFTAHSIFWYKGWFGSAGMWRVMAGIAPAFVLVTLIGFNFGISLFRKIKWLYYTISIVLITIIIVQSIHKIHQHLYEGKIAVRDACNWVKQNNLQSRKIYYSEPYTRMCLSLNPYDTLKSEVLMYVDHSNVGSDMPQKSIIIWEPGLGPNEDGLPLTRLIYNPRFLLLKKFETAHDMAKGQKYAVYVFERE